jgi:hypothetical protein
VYRGRSGGTKEKASMHCDDPLTLSPSVGRKADIEARVRRDRLAVEPRGKILPLADSLRGCLPQGRWPERTFVSVTLPVASTRTSITTTPCRLCARATAGYSGEGE